MMRRKIVVLVLAVILVQFLFGSAKAEIMNGSFETGDLTGWTSVPLGGSIEAVTSHEDTSGLGTGTLSWLPTEGAYFALLKSGEHSEIVQLSQTFTASAGDVLSFDYFWDSWDTAGYNDSLKIWITYPILDGQGGTDYKILSYESISSDPFDFWGTPWKSVEYVCATTNTYTLMFDTWNSFGFTWPEYWQSYVGIDNVTLTQSVNPVPIPSTILLGIIGLGTGFMKLRKKSKTLEQ